MIFGKLILNFLIFSTLMKSLAKHSNALFAGKN